MEDRYKLKVNTKKAHITGGGNQFASTNSSQPLSPLRHTLFAQGEEVAGDEDNITFHAKQKGIECHW